MGNCQKAFKNGTSKIDYIVKILIIWKSNKVEKIKKYIFKETKIFWGLNFKLFSFAFAS